MKRSSCFLYLLLGGFLNLSAFCGEIPLPEHPRPDFQREQWMNLNGMWDFEFDGDDKGLVGEWYKDPSFSKTITVPFPWGSALSKVEDEADIGWYNREFTVPREWEGREVFIVFGAADWKTDVWIDGRKAGSHRGGYTPFEMNLTPLVEAGKQHRLVVRVDDTPYDYKLEGKQGYGEAKGIWQTVYLEARSKNAIKNIFFTPDIDQERVHVKIILNRKMQEEMFVELDFPNEEILSPHISPAISKGGDSIGFEVPVSDPHLWSIEDPYLYEVIVRLRNKDRIHDEVNTYFGMRKISIMNLPDTDIPYVALNNRPLYLQMSLDQAYHPEGFYTYPDDDFMRDEILRSKKIGLNANRIHIKAEIPRKLYWADRLGLLIMADVPNFWGEPGAEAKKEWEYAMQEMIRRDYNHPSVFSWVLFNETWGLFTGHGENRRYLPETQEWVKEKFLQAKKLDPSRLIEDNSPCNHDHVITDLNTWHAYLPGYEWKTLLKKVSEQTFPGSGWNFIGENKQTNVPMLNSECGNVWGYEGSTGDVDWSWDYHIMMNEFRKHPKVAGWLYTEHHDVINEWNGYYKYDRTPKISGLSYFVDGMDLNHLHSAVYLSTGSELCREASPGDEIKVPLYLSVMTPVVPENSFILEYKLWGYDYRGQRIRSFSSAKEVPSSPWYNGELEPLAVKMPSGPGLYHLSLQLKDQHGYIYHKNFTSFLVKGDVGGTDDSRVLTFSPNSFSSSEWTQKQWDVMNGRKVNGAGSGHFTYRISVPEYINREKQGAATLVFEASAKKLLAKDMPDNDDPDGDYMRGKGAHDPGRNPNAYPMTDIYKFPTLVRVRVNGEIVGSFYLEDDPADHRGVLSWNAQKKDRRLREAGSYGYLCKVRIPGELLQEKLLTIRFEVDESLPGGLAIYGKGFGRYPVDPVLIFD